MREPSFAEQPEAGRYRPMADMPPQQREYCCAFQRHYAILTINHAIMRVGTIDDGAIGRAAWQRIAPRRDRANGSRGAHGRPPRPPLFRRVGRPPPYTLPAQIT